MIDCLLQDISIDVTIAKPWHLFYEIVYNAFSIMMMVHFQEQIFIQKVEVKLNQIG